jgi:glycosyltransferase involved in cell wall biosynthesis
VSAAAGKRRLLVALSRYPAAQESGSAILIYNNLVELSKNYALHLLCHGTAPGSGDLATFCEKVEFLGRQRSRLPRPLRVTVYGLSGVPHQVYRLRSPRMRRRIAELFARGGFDALLLYEMLTIQYCPASCASRAIACIEDAQSLRLYRMSALPVWTAWQRFRMRLAARQMERYEHKVLPPLARVVLLSEADARDMRRQGGHQNLGVATYCVAPARQDEFHDPRSEGMIVYSGNMHQSANIDGALWFLREVFPRVLEQHPQATLWIVGASPDTRIVAAARPFGERVVITGRVHDVAEYVRRARVSICPVRLEIGVQTKVAEALSMGTPVVSTSAGNRGVAAIPGEEIWIEDEPAGFASRVVALLRLQEWDRLSRNGRRLAAERFTRERSARELERHIEDVRRIQDERQRGGGPVSERTASPGAGT